LLERRTFLTRFYAAAKTSFDIFDSYNVHASIIVDLGYSSLLRGVTDTYLLNSMAILAIGLNLPDSLMDLLRTRSVELGQDIDTFHDRVTSALVAERMRRNHA
jgi:hypothetical protein